MAFTLEEFRISEEDQLADTLDHVFHYQSIHRIQARHTTFKITTADFEVNTERSKDRSHCFEVSDVRETSESLKTLELHSSWCKASASSRGE